MKFWDDIPWEGKNPFLGIVILIVGTPVVLLAWYYAWRALRYILDGAIAWLWWFFKIVAIMLLAGGGSLLLAFNLYQFKYYGHVEPMATVVYYCTRYYVMYDSACAAVQAGATHVVSMYNMWLVPFLNSL